MFVLIPWNPVVPLTPASQPGPPTVICQGSVVFTDGCSTTFSSSCVPAHPAIGGRKKIATTLSLAKRFILRSNLKNASIPIWKIDLQFVPPDPEQPTNNHA